MQEIVEKAPQLPHEIKWHFIGHLQSNKVKSLVNAVPNLFMVETVDSMKIASKLNTEWKKVSQTPLQVLIQVNTSLEEQKHGIMAEDAPQLVQHIHNECDMLEFKGYMTIGKLGSVGAEYFTNLAALKSKEDEELSMGMSNDFALAVRIWRVDFKNDNLHRWNMVVRAFALAANYLVRDNFFW